MSGDASGCVSMRGLGREQWGGAGQALLHGISTRLPQCLLWIETCRGLPDREGDRLAALVLEGGVEGLAARQARDGRGDRVEGHQDLQCERHG